MLLLYKVKSKFGATVTKLISNYMLLLYKVKSKFGRHKTQESGVLRCPSYSKTSKGIIKELKGTSWNS